MSNPLRLTLLSAFISAVGRVRCSISDRLRLPCARAQLTFLDYLLIKKRLHKYYQYVRADAPAEVLGTPVFALRNN